MAKYHVLSIDNDYVGMGMVETTIDMDSTQGVSSKSFVDNSDGYLLDSSLASGSNIVGKVLYNHGLIVFDDYVNQDATYQSFIEAMDSSNTSISFKAKHRIFEQRIACHIDAGEYNGSTNPTNVTGSFGEYINQNLAYITTIGLYNEDGELIMTGRLASAIENDPTQEMTIIIRHDL